MTLHRAPLPPLRHRDFFVVDASLQYFAHVLVRRLIVATQHTHLYDVALLKLPEHGIVHICMVLYPSSGMDS